MPDFTEEDLGKTVINPVNEEIGIVEDVVDGVPYVDPDPTLGEQIKVDLGWGDDPDVDEHPLGDKHIEEVTEDAVILREDLYVG